MKKYFVYVLRSKTDKNFYTGFTTDLINRLSDHNAGKVSSTKKRIPFEIFYYEVCLCLEYDIHREKYLKTTYGKRYIKNRIKNYLNNTKT